ncbi:MAG TPA: hypothetical protein VM123_07690 [archaeon]|nr:hypothetical protein [archaeon]
MSITMRVIQQYDIKYEKEFMELERKFAELESRRKDYRKGKRLKPLSACEPCNTLVWECEFPDLQAAKKWLDFLGGDGEHQELFIKQAPYFKQVKIEFYENLEY